jgi:hypothetical protein
MDNDISNLITSILTTNDLYKQLGVNVDATQNEIKKEFKKRVKLLHPDKCHHDNTSIAFSKVKEAYTILSDTEKRKFYDTCKQVPSDINLKNDLLLFSLIFNLPSDIIFDDFMKFIVQLIKDKTELDKLLKFSIYTLFLFFIFITFIIPINTIPSLLIGSFSTVIVAPVVVWEQLVALYQEKTLTKKLLSSDAPYTLYSIAKTSTKLTSIYIFIICNTLYTKTINLVYNNDKPIDDDWIVLE